MVLKSNTENDDVNQYFIKIDFGVVPVGSVHKKTIDITNDLKKPVKFKVKNNNETMYLADSISFEPSETPKILPNRKTTFLIIFFPKSVHIDTTLEFFTIFSVEDQTEIMNDDHDEFESHDEIVQQVTVRVQGSCYGPSVKISPNTVFIHQSGEKKETTKSVNLVNSSEMPGQYQIHYDWFNSPLKCHPPLGVINKRQQIKLELKPNQIGNYYKRVYILIMNHHPVYVDVYVFSSTATMVDPFSYFRRPFKLPKYENNYADFFKDITTSSLANQQYVDVLPKELHFGYWKNTKTLSFDVHNNSDLLLCINWIINEPHRDNPFTIHPKRFYIERHEKKTLKCEFRPTIISKMYLVELEATVHHFDSTDQSLPDHHGSIETLPAYIAPINISLTASGHSFKKPFNGRIPKCKLSTSKIIMPPSVPASNPVFTTFFIKKMFQMPTTFEFQPPDKSMFLIKPKCGLINGDYQIVVVQFSKTNLKESLYTERWRVVFGGFDEDSVSLNIYASVEYGCVKIGEKNHVLVPHDVHLGCEIDLQIPIVNMTRHRLHYYINIYDQQPKAKIEYSSSLRSINSDILEELKTEEMEESTYTRISDFQNEPVDAKFETSKSSTQCNNSTIMSIESTQSLNDLKNKNYEKTLDHHNILPFVFKFNKPTGELGPNEKSYLKLSFCPLENVLYTMYANCYIICNDFPDIVNLLPVILKGSGCKTQLEITPINCKLNDTMVNTHRIQHFIIKNKSCSYANIKIAKMTKGSVDFWPISDCKINPKNFQFTPEQNQCKMDLSIYPTVLGFQTFFINIQCEPTFEGESDSENENIITVSMNVIAFALQISRITNDSLPYFGKLALNKLFHCVKVNDELSKVYTKNTSSLIWNIPIVSNPTIYELQLSNTSRLPISWSLKFNECTICVSKTNNKANGTLSNKCMHNKGIRILPTENIKMGNFSKTTIELNNINTDDVRLSYKWSSGFYKCPLYNTKLLLEPKQFTDDLISFDPKYGGNGHLEFNFMPTFIAHSNPPAQAFWVYNNNDCEVEYSIIDDSLEPAYPYFCCLNPSGIVYPKSVHPLLFEFAPNKLSKFEASVMLLTNNNRHQITLLGQGESFKRTSLSLGPGLSSFLPKQNDRKIFLSTENIILQPMLTYSNIKSIFCLYNNSDEDIMFEWKECTVEKLLTAIIMPFRGSLKGHTSQVFEITVSSYNQPATLTIMLNISYKLVSQYENYKQSLKNYNNNKDKLEGVFIINKCGRYKPKLNMKIEKQPQEKHLVLYVYVRIIDEFNNKWINEAKQNIKKHNFQQKIQSSANFRNILWSIVDNICSKEIEFTPLYYYQLRKSKKNIPSEISKTTKSNLEDILTTFIQNSLINIYPLKMWKN